MPFSGLLCGECSNNINITNIETNTPTTMNRNNKNTQSQNKQNKTVQKSTILLLLCYFVVDSIIDSLLQCSVFFSFSD
jgi:hypothetical protein